MKVLGLLVVAFFLSVLYLVGFKCYTLAEFQQELANFVHLPIGSAKPGGKVSPQPCPSFNPFDKPANG